MIWLNNILKVGVVLSAAVAPSAAFSFSDEVKAAANQIDSVAGLSREFSRNLNPEMYGLCTNGHVFTLAAWARGQLADDNILLMWVLIGRGLGEYRNASANQGRLALLDSMVTAQKARWDQDIGNGARLCTDLLTAPLN